MNHDWERPRNRGGLLVLQLKGLVLGLPTPGWEIFGGLRVEPGYGKIWEEISLEFKRVHPSNQPFLFSISAHFCQIPWFPNVVQPIASLFMSFLSSFP